MSVNAVWTGQAFGLSLGSDFGMPGLPSSSAGAGRRCDLFLRTDPRAEGDWGAGTCERMYAVDDVGGRLASTLDLREDGGARLWGRERGNFFIEGDGSSVRCYPESAEPWQWRRFLVGQVLPLAALLRGFEILHASAVVVEDNVVVFAGPPRAGKSSVAAQLTLRGATLVADDVVSIERQGDVVIAHPGTPMIGLRHEERALWSTADLQVLGVPVAERDAETLIAARHFSNRPCRLRVVYLLDRWSDGVGDDIIFDEALDPRYLLASTFNDALRTRERLVRMLDACSALSRSARVFRVNVPASMTAADVAAAVSEHLEVPSGPRTATGSTPS